MLTTELFSSKVRNEKGCLLFPLLFNILVKDLARANGQGEKNHNELKRKSKDILTDAIICL